MEAAVKRDFELEQKLNKVDEMLEKYKGQRGALLQALQEAQGIVGYLPLEVQKRWQKP
nr:NAD(P)H-dependent oxidoreductase subunit E [Biomaibacter acetigenes]